MTGRLLSFRPAGKRRDRYRRYADFIAIPSTSFASFARRDESAPRALTIVKAPPRRPVDSYGDSQ
jgi:hypothetical protein